MLRLSGFVPTVAGFTAFLAVNQASSVSAEENLRLADNPPPSSNRPGRKTGLSQVIDDRERPSWKNGHYCKHFSSTGTRYKGLKGSLVIVTRDGETAPSINYPSSWSGQVCLEVF
jgi:hypothetical protein